MLYGATWQPIANGSSVEGKHSELNDQDGCELFSRSKNSRVKMHWDTPSLNSNNVYKNGIKSLNKQSKSCKTNRNNLQNQIKNYQERKDLPEKLICKKLKKTQKRLRK